MLRTADTAEQEGGAINATAEQLSIPSPEHVDQRVMLHAVRWQDYENLVMMRGDNSGMRITYLQGELELMTPSIDHESYKTRLARLLEAYAEERDIDLEGYGSWTIRAQDKNIGVEPDECYLIGPFNRDFSVPDLALEVVWTSGGIGKLAVYRQLGVPEVWYWEQGQLLIFILERDGYEQRSRSVLLPGLDPALLAGFMQEESQTQAVRAYRRVLRQPPSR